MISTDSTSGNFDWSSLEGTTLEGGYQVAEQLSSDDRTACFRIRVLGEYRRNAFANFYRATGPAAQEQLDIWKRAREIRHANLSVPLGAGRLPFQGSEVVYVVLDKPDEILSGVLQKRELVSEEADPILRGVARALQELHAHELVHGTVSPDQVFAFGDSIKLSTEGLRKLKSAPPLTSIPAKYLAPESSGENVTPEADVWCMAATLFEALTQKRCGPECRESTALLPEPWNRILPKCLEADPAQRARLSDLDRLRAGEPVRETAATLPVPAPMAAEPQAGSTAAEQELSSVAKRQSVTPVERIFHASRSWIYAAVALVAVVVLLWAARPKHPAPAAGPNPPAQTATAKQPASSWPTRTLAPETASHNDAHPDARIAATPKTLARSGDPAVWRVVLYTFSREEDAQKRAQAINQQHPGLNTQVFSPAGGRNHMYLVVAGGRMTRDQAARLRQEALREGMPHDSYIQNYKQ
jgi:hypothetical protein